MAQRAMDLDVTSGDEMLLQAVKQDDARARFPMASALKVGSAILVLSAVVAFATGFGPSSNLRAANPASTVELAATHTATISLGMAGLASWDAHFVITSLTPNSPAADAGVQVGWTFVKIDGIDVKGTVSIDEAKKKNYPNFVNGKSKTVELTGEFVDKQGKKQVKKIRLDLLGFTFDVATGKIKTVTPGSSAADHGVKAGNTVVSINGKPYDKKAALAQFDQAKKDAFKNFLAGKKAEIQIGLN